MSEQSARAQPAVAGQVSPADYRLGVKALISDQDAVLLQQERHEDGRPFWTLPGGGQEADESRDATIRRELREELQCEIVIGQPIDYFSYVHESRSSTVSLYTVLGCDILQSPVPNPREGVYAQQWCQPDQLPPRTLPEVQCVVQSNLD